MEKSKQFPVKKKLSRQTKLKRTMLALLALTIVESVYVLFGHRFHSFSIVVLLLIIVLTTIIAWTWFEINFETAGQKSMVFIKTLVFVAPIMFLTIILQDSYKDYNISNNKRSTQGIVVRTYSELSRMRFRKVTNYYADINCTINGQPTKKTISINSINQFEFGDKVTVEYSETEPELFNVILTEQDYNGNR